MMALIRKDLPWLWPLFAAAAASAFGVTMSSDVEYAWLTLSPRPFEDLQHALWISATLAGALLALRDPVGRTEDLLAHRSVTPERALRARLVAGLAFVVLVGAVPLLVDVVRLGREGLLGQDVVDWSRAGVLASLTLFATASFAVAFFALTLPVGWGLRLVVLAVTWLTVALLHTGLAGSRSIDVGKPVLPHALAMLGVTVLLLVVTRWCATVRFDADRPLPRRTVPGVLIVAGVATAVAATLAVSLLESWGIESLGRSRPFAMVREDGSVTLARWLDRQDRRLEVLDAEQEVTGVAARDDTMRREAHAERVRVPVELDFEVRFYSDHQTEQVLVREPDLAVWTITLDRATGLLRAHRKSFGGGESTTGAGVDRPDGARFSPHTALFETGPNDREALFVADPEDGSVWRIVLPGIGADVSLESTPVPDGDGAVAVEWVRTGGETPRFEEGLAGRASHYAWDGTAWQTASPANSARPDAGRETDALTPLLVAEGTDVRAPFRHRVTLSSFGDKLFAVAAAAPAVLRPLPSALATVIAPDRTTRRGWLRDPVIADRRWLLILPLFGTAWALLGVRRRLRALGAEQGRVRAWLIATAVGGPAIWFLMRAVETDRAHRTLARRTAPPPRILTRALDAEVAADSHTV